MNWMDLFLVSPLTHTLGWTLLHSLWMGGAVALPLATLFSLSPAMSPSKRGHLSYGGLVLIGLLTGLAFLGLWSGDPIAMGPIQSRVTGGGVGFPEPFLSPVPGVLQTVQSQLSQSMPMITLVWLLGVLLSTARLGQGLGQLRRLKRGPHAALPTQLVNRLRALVQQFGLEKRVNLFGCQRMVSPIVYGHLRPVILFPVSLIGAIPMEQLEALLAHELAHIKRHDYLLNLILRMMRTLLFFNPGFLYLIRVWERERESSCDLMATQRGVKPISLAQALLGLNERQRALLNLTPAALGRGSLKRRIQLIFGESKVGAKPEGFALPLLLGALLVGTLFLASRVSVQAASEAPLNAQTVARTADSTDVVASVGGENGPLDEHKKKIEALERLRIEIEALRKQKADPKRDRDLMRLEKRWSEMASEALMMWPTKAEIPAQVARPDFIPVLAELAEPVAPVAPLEELGDVVMVPVPEALDEVAQPDAPPSLEAHEQDLVKRERELARQAERLARQEKQRERRLLQVEERQAQILAREWAQLERQKGELKEQQSRLKKEDERFKAFEAEITQYLMKNRLVDPSAPFHLEIEPQAVRLDGKNLTEVDVFAINQLAGKWLKEGGLSPDRRIVIQR